MANLIEPSSFDLIVLGTGLPQCIVAAAAAINGHSVLHLDTCDFYGSHWASLPLQDFSDWCHAAGKLPFPSSLQVPASLPMSGSQGDELRDHCSSSRIEAPGDLTVVQNEATLLHDTQNLCGETQDGALRDGAESLTAGEDNKLTQGDYHAYSCNTKDDSSSMRNSLLSENANTQELTPNQFGSDLSSSMMEELGLELTVVDQSTSMYHSFSFLHSSAESLAPSRSFYIDLAGPKLAYCAESLVDLLISCGASNYLEFKSLEASFMWSTNGLLPVPSSRADVFKDRTMNNAEKRHLMRFFKLVVDHTSPNANASQISQEELESPFVDFLQGRQIPSSVQAMILYAIALSDGKQDAIENGGSSMMSTRKGVESLALYLTSVGRFPNSTGAFLYPLYGQGELPQAFSRSAAVKGALYALKMPVKSLLKDKETGNFKGVQMSTNQLIFSGRLVVGPTMCSTLRKGFSSETASESGGGLPNSEHHEDSAKVVRGVCITNKSLSPDLCTIMVVFPPHSITLKENGVIRALQLGSSVSVCPEGKFIVQLSMVCSNELVGVEALQQATKLLFRLQDSSHVAEEQQPTLLWAAFYAHDVIYSQGFKWISAGHIAAFGMPDETLHFQTVVAAAENLGMPRHHFVTS
ncbi:hypothetical protein GOP47_0000706 [Adiantum capillus-veneris]|uniref:Rab proteins geranylgeranyltransferase component n=1 Tax=Adiantum capillus-veneris TaxID=13818 RepID=A0A9D4VFM0_ADICA|nr:hypothetical protein GOP47_0000706 [Adiantum capillus-veneris]